MGKNVVPLVVFLVVVVAGGVVMQYFVSHSSSSPHTAVTEADISEVERLTDNRAPFTDFEATFQNIALLKGGAYAFELMRRVHFPFGLDLHLLGHAVGDILYEQEGISGMSICTHDFRNACSHTMVIGALIEFGTGAFPDIRDACHAAPGGKGAYTMCFHGLGHGVFA